MNEKELEEHIQQGNLDALANLLRQNPNAIHSDNSYKTLSVAIQECPDAILLLAHSGADVNARNDDGETVLSLAIDYGGTRSVALLLDGGANPDLPDSEGNSPLHNASYVSPSGRPSDKDKVALLLHAGANPHLLDPFGCSPLDNAYSMANGEIARLLIASGAQLTRMAGTDGADLALAALSGIPESVNALFERGVSINARDSRGMTALHVATKSGDASMVAHLIECGADVNAREDYEDRKGVVHPSAGNMPIHYAADECHAEVVRVLLANGADIEASSDPRMGHTPLMSAAFSAGIVSDEEGAKWSHRQTGTAHETMKVLIDHGANIHAVTYSARDKCEMTALSVAAQFADPGDVKFLLDYGTGNTEQDLLRAIHAATLDEGYRNLPVLWEAGRKLSSPLMLIDTLPHIDGTAIRVLLEGKYEIAALSRLDRRILNEANADGETPLLWVIRHMQIEKDQYGLGFAFDDEHVQILLRHGADPNRCDLAGRSPLQEAQRRGLTRCIELLIHAGAKP